MSSATVLAVVVLLAAGCGSPSSAHPGAARDAASADVELEAGEAEGPRDAGGPDAAADALEEPATDAGTCPERSDGSTGCILYATALDGAPLDEAGAPDGITVFVECVPKQPCAACVTDTPLPGLCEAF